MGFWVKCGNKMMEVTSFKIIEYNHIDKNRKPINSKEGIMLFSSDAEQILVNYCSEHYTKIVFNKLVSHVARLEILTKCVENFDAEILNEETRDEVTLAALESTFIFQLPVDKNDKILKKWIAKDDKKNKESRKDSKTTNEKKDKENTKSN